MMVQRRDGRVERRRKKGAERRALRNKNERGVRTIIEYGLVIDEAGRRR